MVTLAATLAEAEKRPPTASQRPCSISSYPMATACHCSRSAMPSPPSSSAVARNRGDAARLSTFWSSRWRAPALATVRSAADQAETPAAPAKKLPAAQEPGRFHGFIGQSPGMQGVFRTIEQVADSRAAVFVTGESGTGKEVTAEALHSASRRRDRAFVAINCGAIPENLLESELLAM